MNQLEKYDKTNNKKCCIYSVEPLQTGHHWDSSSVLNSEVSSFHGLVKYTNEAFGTDKSVLFMEVSSIQGVLIEELHCTTQNTSTNRYILYLD